MVPVRTTALAAAAAASFCCGAAAEQSRLMDYDRPAPCVPLAQAPHGCIWTVGPEHSLAVLSNSGLLAENVRPASLDDAALRNREAWRWTSHVIATHVGAHPITEMTIRHTEVFVSAGPTTCYRYEFVLSEEHSDRQAVRTAGRGAGLSCVVVDRELAQVFGLNVELSERRPWREAPFSDFAPMAEALLASLRYRP